MGDTLAKILENLVNCLREDLGKIEGIDKVNIEVSEKEKVIRVNIYTNFYEIDYKKIVKTILRDTRVVKDLFNLDIYVYYGDIPDIQIYTRIRIINGRIVIDITGKLRYDADSFIYYVNSLGLGASSVKIIDYIRNNPKEMDEEISKAHNYIMDVISRIFGMYPKYKIFDRYDDLSKCDKYDLGRYIFIWFETHVSELNNGVISDRINELTNLLYNIYDAISDKIYKELEKKALNQ